MSTCKDSYKQQNYGEYISSPGRVYLRLFNITNCAMFTSEVD